MNKGLCKVVLDEVIKDNLKQLYCLTIKVEPSEKMMYALNKWGVKRSRWEEYEEDISNIFKDCEGFYKPFVFYTIPSWFVFKEEFEYTTTNDVKAIKDVLSMSLVSDELYLTPQQARIISAAKLVSFD